MLRRIENVFVNSAKKCGGTLPIVMQKVNQVLMSISSTRKGEVVMVDDTCMVIHKYEFIMFIYDKYEF